MKITKYILTLTLMMLVGTLYAQQEGNNTFYKDQMNIVNPAFAWAGNTTSLVMASRSQWQGVKNAPETQSFIASTPFSVNSGIGLSLLSDKTFVEKQTAIYVDYSYKLKLQENLDLYLGLKAGGTFLDVNVSNLETFSYDFDPNLINSKQFNPNMGAGAYLKGDKYYIALSAPRLLNTERLKEKGGIVSKATDKVHTYLSGGYDVTLNDNATLKPSVMVRNVVGAPISSDFTLTLEYLKKVEFGGAYRTDGTFSGIAIFRALQWMEFGYAYESVTNNSISNVSNGTHEFFLKFILQK